MSIAPALSSDCYAILRTIKVNPHYCPADREKHLLIRHLHHEGYVTDNIVPYGRHLTAKGIEALRLEDERLSAAEKAAQELAHKMAQDAADAERKQIADDAKVAANDRKHFSHDFKVAAFSIAGALLVEHFEAILDFLRKVFENIISVLCRLH